MVFMGWIGANRFYFSVHGNGKVEKSEEVDNDDVPILCFRISR